MILSEGMFMDGVIYAGIAKNLSEGIGSLWIPQFTETSYHEFHEHPPLAMGLLSIVYQLFGDQLYIEKLYSLSCILIQCFFIHIIWKKIIANEESWIPVLIFLIFPLIIWTSTNNMLENTMMIFTTLSLILYLEFTISRNLIFIFLSGISLCMGFFCKGPVALFIWVFPFLFQFIALHKSFYKGIQQSFLLILLTCIPFFLLYFFSHSIQSNINQYFHFQIVRSLNNIVTVSSRFKILEQLFTELILPIIALVIIILYRNSKKINNKLVHLSLSLCFIISGMFGVVPIMISLKQSGFYIIPSLPFFAIGLAILFVDLLNISNIRLNFYRKNIFLIFSIFIFSVALLCSLYFKNSYGRDRVKLSEIKNIIKQLPEHSIIQTCGALKSDYSLEAYLWRYKKISLDDHPIHNYILESNACNPELHQTKDSLLTKENKEFKLYHLN